MNYNDRITVAVVDELYEVLVGNIGLEAMKRRRIVVK